MSIAPDSRAESRPLVGADSRKMITIITPCYNEELNVREVHRRLLEVASRCFQNYRFEHLFIDNASTDGTVEILRTMASEDSTVKVIVNARNVGADRSGMHAFLQARGDAIGSLVADLQDLPELLVAMIREWEKGFPIVAAIKNTSDENTLDVSVAHCLLSAGCATHKREYS